MQSMLSLGAPTNTQGCVCTGAIWELHDLAAKARGHKTNCILLDSFLQDIMRTLDSQGRALADADSLQLAHLLELIEAAIELVDSCNKPGLYFVCSRSIRCQSALQSAAVACGVSRCKHISRGGKHIQMHPVSALCADNHQASWAMYILQLLYMSISAGCRLVAANGWSQQIL